MSVKTFKKRIALIATVALGFGLMSVVPASATLPASSSFTAIDSYYAQVGVVSSQTIAMTVANQIGHVWTVAVTNTLRPGATPTAANLAAPTADGTFTLRNTGFESPFVDVGSTASGKAEVANTSAGLLTITGDAAGDSSAANKVVGTFKFKPLTVGLYTFHLASNATGAATLDFDVLVGSLYAPTLTSGTTTLTGTGTDAASATGAVGTAVNFNTVVTGENTPVAADSVDTTPVLTGTADAASALTVANLTPTAGTLTNMTSTIVSATGVVTTTTTATAAAGAVTNYTFTPDVPGTYVLTFSTVNHNYSVEAVFTYTATLTNAKFMTTGNTPAPVAQTVTSGSNLTAVAGGFAKFAIVQGGTANLYNIVATGMTIQAATPSAAHTTNINGVNVGGGVQWAPTAVTETMTITVSASEAGSGSLTVTPISAGGVPSTPITGTVTWIAGTSTAISAAASSFATVSDLTACVDAGSKAATDTALAAVARSSASMYDSTGLVRAVYACLVPRDANGTVVAGATHVYASTSGGNLGAGAATKATATPAKYQDYGTVVNTAPYAGAAGTTMAINIQGDGITVGATTIALTVVDALGNTASFSAPVTFYGKVATLALTDNVSSAGYGDTTFNAADAVAGEHVGTAVVAPAVYVSAKDAAGNSVASADIVGTTYAWQGNVTAAKLNVQSTNTADVVAATAGKSNAKAVATVARASVSGTAAIGFDCSLQIKAEKLVFKAFAYNSTTAAWDIASGSSTFYCSDVASTVSVTTTAADLAVGGSTTVNVKVLDANGYPVADGTSVSLAATNGSVIAPSTKTTAGGVFTTAPTFIAGSGGSSSIVTAVSGGKVGNATITISGGASDASAAAADAAAEATDAANAATDAANAAAEAADAATAAAQDAADAVAALSAQVATLISGLKAQLTALTNLVIKIQKKVKA